MNKLLRLFDFVFLTRPVLFIPGWATLLVGYLTATGLHQIVSNLQANQMRLIWVASDISLALFAFSFAMGGSFILNQLCDVETDQQNNKLFLIGDDYISTHTALWEALILLVLSALLSLGLSLNFLLLVLAFILITGYVYNYAPFRFKDRAVPGLIANILMGWLAFLVGWILAKPFSVQMLWLSLPVLFYNTALYLLTTLPDKKGDVESNKVTIAVQHGTKTTIFMSLSCFVGSFVLALFQQHELLLIELIILSPFLVRMAWRQHVSSAIVSVKVGISVFALCICFYFPLFFVLLASLYVFTRLYYRYRFAFDYPNFRGR